MTGDVVAGEVSRLGWRAQRRPRPGFAHVLGAAAGAFAVVAVVSFIVEVATDDPTVPGVAFTAGLAIVALVLGFFVPGPIRSACVTALVLTIPLVWIFALLGDGDFDRSGVRGIYLLSLACYLVLYLVGWTKGRAIFLAGTLLFFATWITFEVAGSDSNAFVPFQSEVSSGTSSTGTFDAPTNSLSLSNSSDTSDSTSAVALVIGIVFLAVGTMLDRRKLEGAATPFIVVGTLETIVGAVVLGGNQSVLMAGLLALVGGCDRRHHRRARRSPARDNLDRRAHGLRWPRRGARRHRAQQRVRVSERSRSGSQSVWACSHGGSRRCSVSPTTATTGRSIPAPRRPVATSCRFPKKPRPDLTEIQWPDCLAQRSSRATESTTV